MVIAPLRASAVAASSRARSAVATQAASGEPLQVPSEAIASASAGGQGTQLRLSSAMSQKI